MEQSITNNTITVDKPFIEANTLPVRLEELEQDHIIPVFTRDNTPLISQSDFIDLFSDEMHKEFGSANNLEVRVSHPIKGRVPAARNKKAADLLPHEKTLYYQRMMFIVRINTSMHQLNGQQVELVAGGIKAYNQDRLDSYQNTQQHFKIFIGMQVKVCANLCVFTDGAQMDVKVTSLKELRECIQSLALSYQFEQQRDLLEEWPKYALDEDQFTYFLGRCKMYHQMPYKKRKQVPELLLGDSQISSVAQGYFEDKAFKNDNGYIDLWSLYNFLTAANKSSYIDKALERNINAGDMVGQFISALHGEDFWYLKQMI